MKSLIKNYKITGTVGVIICVVIWIVILIKPTGNFIAGPVYLMFYYFPLTVLQLLIASSLFSFKSEGSSKKLALLCYGSLLISIMCVGLFVYYCLTVS